MPSVKINTTDRKCIILQIFSYILAHRLHILYISYDGMTDPLGQSQVLPYLIGLSKFECSFTLISFEKSERFEKEKELIGKICLENNITWIPLSYTRNPPVLSTLWDLFKMQQAAVKVFKEKHIDIIHCRSYISSLIGLKMKKKYNVKFLFDMRGFWADERVDGGLWNLSNPIYKRIYTFFKRKERDFLRYSDAVISLTYAGKNEMLKWNIPNLHEDKISVIPCAADYELFEESTPEKKRLAKQHLGLSEDTFVLSYIGSLGTWYMLDEMLDFFCELKEKIDPAKFLFLTPDSHLIYDALKRKNNLSVDDFIIKFIKRKDIPTYLHASDYSIFFIKPTFSKKSSSPTKMGELLALGVPVICNNIADVESLISSLNCGFCLTEFTSIEYAETLIQMCANSKFNSEVIRNNSKPIFDLNIKVLDFYTVYNRLQL